MYNYQEIISKSKFKKYDLSFKVVSKFTNYQINIAPDNSSSKYSKFKIKK